jgi:nucleotide-binding universal stress UspA family protein
MTGIRGRGVVVGVDETPASRAALAFAMREAARRGSAVEVITAWSRQGMNGTPSSNGAIEPSRQRAQQIQDTAVALALREIDDRPVLSRQVVEGDAGEVLSRLAKDAAYLVVGSSRTEPQRDLSLGSVTDYCVRHATCAVVVIPPPTQGTKPTRRGVHDAR